MGKVFKGPFINYVNKQGGRGVSQMSKILHEAMYLVDLSAKRGGWSKHSKYVNVIYECSVSYI